MLVRRLGLSLAAGVAALAGAGFLVAAAYLWLRHLLAPPAAAGVVGGVLLVIALLFLLLAGRRSRSETGGAEQLVFVALRMIARAARAAPRMSLAAAVIASVLLEWFGDREGHGKSENRDPPRPV